MQGALEGSKIRAEKRGGEPGRSEIGSGGRLGYFVQGELFIQKGKAIFVRLHNELQPRLYYDKYKQTS